MYVVCVFVYVSIVIFLLFFFFMNAIFLVHIINNYFVFFCSSHFFFFLASPCSQLTLCTLTHCIKMKWNKNKMCKLQQKRNINILHLKNILTFSKKKKAFLLIIQKFLSMLKFHKQNVKSFVGCNLHNSFMCLIFFPLKSLNSPFYFTAIMNLQLGGLIDVQMTISVHW